MKYQAKQKHLLPYHVTRTNQNKFYINKCIINIDGNDKFTEINIKNCACSYFNDLINIEAFDVDNHWIKNRREIV